VYSLPATQQDFANRLNLSRSLVGGVLSNHPGLRASKETRRRIVQVAKELGYRPNSAASNLRRGKTGVVSFVYRRDTDEDHGAGFGDALSSLATGVSGLDFELQIRPFPSHESLLSGLREIASRSQCDAVVLWVEHGGEAAAQLLESLGLPFIIKGRYEERHPSWLQVDFDHEAMMMLAVKHLASAGHERIGYIGPDSVEDYAFFLRRGFIDAMQSLGKNGERWMAHAPEEPLVVGQLIAKWLSTPEDERPSALVIGNSPAAWEGLEFFLAKRGRRLGLEVNDFAASGGRNDLPLLYGEAMAFDHVELSDIAKTMITMLQGIVNASRAPLPPIVRIVPKLCRQPSLRLPLGNFESYNGPFRPHS